MKNLFKFFVIFLTFNFSLLTFHTFAQWQQTNGPYGGTVNCLAVKGDTIFAGTDYDGIFLSVDNGTNWMAMNNGIPYNGPLGYIYIYCLTISQGNIFAGTGDGVVLSTDNGGSWNQVNYGFPYDSIIGYQSIYSLAISDTNIFASPGGSGVFLSTNNGKSWSIVNESLTDSTNTFVLSLAISGVNIFAGTDRGVYLSTNNGKSWSAVNNGLTNLWVNALVIDGENIFVGTDVGGVFLSTDTCKSWKPVNNGLTNLNIRSLTISGTNIFAGTYGGGVFISTDNGKSWGSVNKGLTDDYFFSLASNTTNIFAGAMSGGVFLSKDMGLSWKSVNKGFPPTSIVTSLAISGVNVFAGLEHENEGGGIFLSTDEGTYWNVMNNGVNESDGSISSFAIKGSNIFAGTGGFFGMDGEGVFLSIDSCKSWKAMNNGLTNLWVNALVIDGENIYAGTRGGVFLSTNNGGIWTAVNNELTDIEVNALAIDGGNIFAGTFIGGVFLSTDNGTNWKAMTKGLPYFPPDSNTYDCIQSLVINGKNIFASTNHFGVFVSKNMGESWEFAGLNDLVVSFAVKDSNVFAGTIQTVWGGGEGIFLSTDNGGSWNRVNYGFPYDSISGYPSIYSLAINGINIFAGTYGAGVWKQSLIGMGINELQTTNYELRTEIYPNPVNQSSYFSYQLSEKTNIKLTIFDLTGREITTLLDETKDKGDYKINFNTESLCKGLYFLKASTNTAVRVVKFVKE